MYYRRKPPFERRFSDYFMPFLIIVIIVAIIVFGWRMVSNMVIGGGENNLSEKVFLNIDSGTVKAMTVGKSEWQNAYDNIYLYRGEKVKTGVDGRAFLTFFEKSLVRLDNNTEADLDSLSSKNETTSIAITLPKGQVWAKVERMVNPASSFTVITDNLRVDTRGGTIAVMAPATVYVLSGSATVGIKSNDEVIKTVNVGVGQQFMIDEAGLAALKEGTEKDMIFAISDDFKASEFYRWNMQKDGAISAFEESDTETTDETTGSETTGTLGTEEGTTTTTDTTTTIPLGSALVKVTKPAPDSATSKSTFSMEGLYNADKVAAIYVDGKKASLTDGTWKVSGLTLTSEGENSFAITADDLTGKKLSFEPFTIDLDKTAPVGPSITVPGINDSIVPVTSVEVAISGSVSKDTEKVIVNDYTLAKYVPGSKTWQYQAKVAYGNLKAGDNEFLVYAVDKAGNQSDPAKITLTLAQSVIDEAKVTPPVTDGTTPPATTSVPKSTSTGGVKITAPNGGESFSTSETQFEITGTVPAGTASVVVNDYKLGAFKEGDTTFKYRASATLGNLTIGIKNTYKVMVYDADSKNTGSASITIDVASDTTASPTFTMPATSGTYSTTLDEIAIGGGVGKWVQKVYVNEVSLDSYIPGSETWRKNVKLSVGENVFTVYGEKDGVKTGSASLTITYQP